MWKIGLSQARRQWLTFSRGPAVNSSAGEWVWWVQESRSWNTSRLQMFPGSGGQDRALLSNVVLAPQQLDRAHVHRTLLQSQPPSPPLPPSVLLPPPPHLSKTQRSHSIKLEPAERRAFEDGALKQSEFTRWGKTNEFLLRVHLRAATMTVGTKQSLLQFSTFGLQYKLKSQYPVPILKRGHEEISAYLAFLKAFMS